MKVKPMNRALSPGQGGGKAGGLAGDLPGRAMNAFHRKLGESSWMLPLLLAAASGLMMFTPWGSALAGEGGKEIDFVGISMRLFGGLAIFLYGMEKMGDALKMVAGDKMKEILGKLTTNRFMGLITGLVVTAIIQSSSVTTVMLVGFVTADLMTLNQAIGVILGADIGTTVTAQIVAFKVTKFASLLIAVGFVMIFASRVDKTKHYGHLIMGLGLIFFGMGEMSNAMKPLRTYEPFIAMMQGVSNPVVGILISTAFTGLIQSSSATMGVVVALAMQGLITLEGGIALAFGANIGTCATAALAAIGKPREAVRVAVAHITFKIAGVAFAAFLIPQLADLVRAISPVAPDHLTGMDKLAHEVPRQVANAHTVFNVVMAAAFLPIGGLFARFCEWVVPAAPPSEEPAYVGAYRPQYLDESLLTTPPLALAMVRREVELMSVVLDRMLTSLPDALFSGDEGKINALRTMDDEVDRIHKAIIHYLAQISSHNMTETSSDEVMAAVVATNELESIGDIIENNLAHLAEVHTNLGTQLPAEVKEGLEAYHHEVHQAYRKVVAALVADNAGGAEAVIAMKDTMQSLDSKCVAHQMASLRAATNGGQMEILTLQADIRENLKRIYYHAKRIAKVVAHTDDAAPWIAYPGGDPRKARVDWGEQAEEGAKA